MWLNLTNIILRKKSQVQTVQTLWFLLCEVKNKQTNKKKQNKKGKLLKTRTALIVLSLGKVWLETSRELNCIPERNAHVLTPTLVNVSLFGNGVSGDLTKDHKMRSSWIVCICISHFSCVQFFLTLWTVVHQAPLSMGFSRQEHWSGLPSPPPGALPDPEIEPTSPVLPALQADSLLLSHQGSPWYCIYLLEKIYI